MFEIEFTSGAWQDLQSLRKYDQQILKETIETQLTTQPTTQTHNRKRLKPNPLAEWELRVGRFRVFYDAFEEPKKVKVNAIGYKQGSQLFIRGEESEL
jgi:mRNA-degrading endonuclease RelE of RelBE toxin-antitoxin system